MKEIWKDIPGWEGYYQVSDRGRVRSVNRVVEHPSGPRRRKGKLMTTNCDSHGYPTVHFTRHGIGTVFYIHRLVLSAFVGPKPDGMECCHNNGEQADNHLSNLRYDTHRSNCADKKIHGTHLAGANHPAAKISSRDVLFIREHKGLVSYSRLAFLLGISESQVSDIMNRRKWKNV